jgi:phosphoglycolate phosphatase
MSGHSPLACLFDLDGTVLNSRRCGVRSMELACEELYGWEKPLEGVLVAGRTDRRIFRDVYVKFCGKVPAESLWEEEMEKFKGRYVEHLERLLVEKRPFLCPGFPAVLESVAAGAGMRPGIATGNFQRGAELKLLAAEIQPSIFAFGSYGCETEERPDLVRLAAVRARAAAGREVLAVVIGDTPEDFRAARTAGAPCALVATGPYSFEDLRELRPDFLARDLSDPSVFIDWLSSLRTPA